MTSHGLFIGSIALYQLKSGVNFRGLKLYLLPISNLRDSSLNATCLERLRMPFRAVKTSRLLN